MQLRSFATYAANSTIVMLTVSLSLTGVNACRSNEHGANKQGSPITSVPAAAVPPTSGASAITSAAPVSAPEGSAKAAAPVKTAPSREKDMLTGRYSPIRGGRYAYLFQSGSKLVGCFGLSEGHYVCEGDFEASQSTAMKGETFRYGPQYDDSYDRPNSNTTAFSDARDKDSDYLLDLYDDDCALHLRGAHHLKRAPEPALKCRVTRSTMLEIANQEVDEWKEVKLTPGQRVQAFNCDPSFKQRYFVRISDEHDTVGYVASADLACQTPHN